MRTTAHRVLITGGAKGIGLALAKVFHAAGNEVILVGRDAKALAIAATQMQGARTHVADVANADECAQLASEFREITILVNNAGIQRNGDFSAMPAADIEHELRVNLIAPMLLAHAFIPHLRRQSEAAVVNVSSVLALVPKQSASVYCASKAGVHSFSRSLRWQLEGTGIRVFELMPPLVETEMTAGRGSGKILPDALATEFWAGFAANNFELRIGKAKVAGLIGRFVPSLAERIMRRG